MKDPIKKTESSSSRSLRDSELRYRRLFETAQDGILILDAVTGMIEDVNPYLIKMLGYSRKEFIKKKLWEVGAFKDIESSKDAFESLQENEYIRYEDLPLKTKDGQLIQVEFISNVYLVGNKKVIQCDIRNITEHKRIITALQKNEKTYHDLINQSPDGFFVISSSGNILIVNKAISEALNYSNEELLRMNIWDIIPKQYLDQYKERLTKILSGKSLKEDAEYIVEGKDGKALFVEIISAPHYSGKNIIGFQGIAHDITALKHQEQQLADLAKFPSENPNPVLRLDRNGILLYANTSSEALLGLWGCDVGDSAPQFWCDLVAQAHLNLKRKTVDVECDGKIYAMIVTPVAGTDYITVYGHDITDLKQSEAALQVSESKFRSYIENAPLGLFVTDGSGRYLEVNKAAHEMLGYTMSELLHLSIPDILAPQSLEAGLQNFQKLVKDGFITSEFLFQQKNGSQFWSTVLAVKLSEDRFMSYCQDISERKQAEEKIRKQFTHLAALSAIDRTIAASFDLKVTLAEILNHLMAEPGIDAAAILIINTSSQMLEYSAERGFRTDAVRSAKVRLGESYAGQVALDRHFIQISQPGDGPENIFLKKFFKGEDFVFYYGLPLITRGQVVGVLEVFQRTVLEPDSEWIDFLNTLAGQAALAVENSSLFETLRRSNIELFQAYDANIEGWSNALDLRDKETEGHTLRVTEMTVAFARNFGLGEDELVHARWGALLHDIGKMGVPDSILLKPGPLTNEEWVKMKEHPTFAYELLSPIRYLQSALDIPYCHHEKWDGSGYPRGLKGTQIPFVARIFAVVDVWDALTSHRPYRPAWTKEQTLEYIRSSSGKHFDPQVVEGFMQMVDKN